MSPITYKEFKDWCNERAQDGQWGALVAMTSINILDKMKHVSFWKKRRVWREEYEAQASAIVDHTTRIAQKLAEQQTKCNRV